MKILTVVVLALLLPSISMADAWTWQDTALQTGFTVALLADRSQTLQIRTHYNNGEAGGTEYFSVLLSKHPTHERTNRLFAAYWISHTVVATLLNKPYRNVWQIGFTVFEINNVNHNQHIGLHMQLKF